MRIDSQRLQQDAIYQAMSLMAMAARTAPKARGWDHIYVIALTEKEKNMLADKMSEIAASGYRSPTFERDAQNVRSADGVLVIGTKKKSLGLDCGFCGFARCALCEEKGAVCAYNSSDLGIAIGSAVSKASILNLDNRVMYTAGYAAIRAGFTGEDVKIAFGIPVSVSGKNIFFDRK